MSLTLFKLIFGQPLSFNSVFEIAFAINALLYLFEAAPFSENQIEKKLKAFYELKEKKVEITKNTYAFPIGFVLLYTYPLTKKRLARCSVVMSTIALIFLIYSGFSPGASIFSWLMIITLSGLLLLVPLCAYFIYCRYTRLILGATQQLQKEIDDYKTSLT
jgi:hypothetical protein